MSSIQRRDFLRTTGSATMAGLAGKPVPGAEAGLPPVDFRYAPPQGQTAYCFPDDPAKSLVGEHGDLRYGHPGQGKGHDYFATVLEFSLQGIEPDVVAAQYLEAPSIPIVHTRIERPDAFLELTTFASNQPGEGRMDNVIVEVRPRTKPRVLAAPFIRVHGRGSVTVEASGAVSVVRFSAAPGLMYASIPGVRHGDLGREQRLMFPGGVASADKPMRFLVRFPQERTDLDPAKAAKADPDQLLASARRWWRDWKPFAGPVNWALPGRYGEFLTACARNILQAREVKNGKATFQVGPTCYRGLWVVDGNFILEAARYLGYDAEVQQGLEATWARQEADGGIYAGAGRQHFKDTGIAMFSLARQAELSQNWTYFREMRPNVLRGVDHLRQMREKAKAEGSFNGRYGLLPKGMGDGGLGGLTNELTNTLWALAGLKAVVEGAERQKLTGFETAKLLYEDLKEAAFRCMREQMVQHPDGFSYLPMLLKEDSMWNAANRLDRPHPQTGQWALSQCIYPGELFAKDDPVVSGHNRLMQACVKEDIPAETGWLRHEGLWTYNAAFVAEAYLWSGLADWARYTFHGFLNHATSLYCWREEQALRNPAMCQYVGDMPHNWASAECIRFLRHCFVLEDGRDLRLLAGAGAHELSSNSQWSVTATPTRFGRISTLLEPSGRQGEWRLGLERASGSAPRSVLLPAALGGQRRLARVEGSQFRVEGTTAVVDPAARKWTAYWE